MQSAMQYFAARENPDQASTIMTSVKTQNLVRRFGETVAVDRINLEIGAGELFFLLGPSGCGKSTLLRMIAGLLEPTEGKIFFGERDVTAVPTSQRNAVMCFQGYALWPHMTVAENVRFGLDVRSIAKADQKKRVDEALALVQLDKLAGRKPAELSGGQQQRVALARALVVRPDCLLLDEPLSNLDAKLRLEMRSEIRRICKEAHLTAIYVTHDQKEALSMADRLAVLNAGKIEQMGPPRQVYQRPVNAFVAGFMGETNLLAGTLKEVANDGRMVVETPLGDLISTAKGTEKLVAGSAVSVSIRPEAVRLGEVAGSTTVNRFEATVMGTIYLGEVAQHTVQLAPAASGGATSGATSVGAASGRATSGRVMTGGAAGQAMKVYEMNPRFAAEGMQPKTVACIAPEDVVVMGLVGR